MCQSLPVRREQGLRIQFLNRQYQKKANGVHQREATCKPEYLSGKSQNYKIAMKGTSKRCLSHFSIKIYEPINQIFPER